MGTRCKVILGFVISITLLLIMTIILVSSSLQKLSSQEVGLMYDTKQRDLGDVVYTEGLHAGPPGYEFIVFPNVFTSMSIDLNCLNADGVTIGLSVSYQYRVQMSGMRTIVLDFKNIDLFTLTLENAGITALYQACSHYNTTEFQTLRGEFKEEFSNILTARYNELSCDVVDLQVNNIKRPLAYENVIDFRERAMEDIDVARRERPRRETVAKTFKREAESEAEIILNKARSEARVRTELAKQEAEAIGEQYEREAEAYKSIIGAKGLGLSAEGFISYLATRVIADAKNPVNINIDSPAKTSYTKS